MYCTTKLPLKEVTTFGNRFERGQNTNRNERSGWRFVGSDNDFKNLYLCVRNGIKKVDLAKQSSSNISFEARFDYKPYQEREYIFNHVWQQVKDKFYVEDIHGVDWEGYRKIYQRFLPYINNEYDFRDMLGELLGELNASHTGARYYGESPSLYTATLGLFFDNTYDGRRFESGRSD